MQGLVTQRIGCGFFSKCRKWLLKGFVLRLVYSGLFIELGKVGAGRKRRKLGCSPSSTEKDGCERNSGCEAGFYLNLSLTFCLRCPRPWTWRGHWSLDVDSISWMGPFIDCGASWDSFLQAGKKFLSILCMKQMKTQTRASFWVRSWREWIDYFRIKLWWFHVSYFARRMPHLCSNPGIQSFWVSFLRFLSSSLWRFLDRLFQQYFKS